MDDQDAFYIHVVVTQTNHYIIKTSRHVGIICNRRSADCYTMEIDNRHIKSSEQQILKPSNQKRRLRNPQLLNQYICKARFKLRKLNVMRYYIINNLSYYYT